MKGLKFDDVWRSMDEEGSRFLPRDSRKPEKYKEDDRERWERIWR